MAVKHVYIRVVRHFIYNIVGADIDDIVMSIPQCIHCRKVDIP